MHTLHALCYSESRIDIHFGASSKNICWANGSDVGIVLHEVSGRKGGRRQTSWAERAHTSKPLQLLALTIFVESRKWS